MGSPNLHRPPGGAVSSSCRTRRRVPGFHQVLGPAPPRRRVGPRRAVRARHGAGVRARRAGRGQGARGPDRADRRRPAVSRTTRVVLFPTPRRSPRRRSPGSCRHHGRAGRAWPSGQPGRMRIALTGARRAADLSGRERDLVSRLARAGRRPGRAVLRGEPHAHDASCCRRAPARCGSTSRRPSYARGKLITAARAPRLIAACFVWSARQRGGAASG